MTHFPLASALAALLVVGPVALTAQSSERATERSVERMADNIAAAAERLAARIERNAALLADRFEREFNKKNSHWDHDRKDRPRSVDDIEWQDARSKIDTTIAFASDGTLELSNVAGDIIVTGWDRREARIKAVSERGRLDVELSSSRITLEVLSSRTGRGERYGGETRYELSVPRGVRVIAHSTSGDITIRGSGGEIDAASTSGDVMVDDAVGRVEISSVSGDVQGSRLKGSVEANSVSGGVEVADVQGDVHVGTTSGDISLTGVTSRDIEASTTSGEIEYNGVVENDGRYEFHSHSGGIVLTIPSASNARFAVETFSGEMESDFPITLQPTDRANGTSRNNLTGVSNRRQRRFEFTVGSGSARIVAETFSGDLEIRKR